MKTRRAAFSLMEVILALALSAIIIGVVTTIVRVHLTALDGRRERIEKAVLARAVLRQISDDLRHAVRYRPPDLSGLESVTDEAASDVLGGADTEAVAGALAAGGVDPSQLDVSQLDPAQLLGGDDSSTSDLITDSVPPAIVGIYGNAHQLLVDVARLPRIDEYTMILGGQSPFELQDIPSDIKTVAYYLDSTPEFAGTPPLLIGSIDTTANAPLDMAQGRGLMRRELDRAVCQEAVQNGNLLQLQESGQKLAPEIIGLRFRYFDGLQWYDQWDSDQKQAMPVAVEVSIYLMPDEAGADYMPETAALAGFNPNLYYRILVPIPVARDMAVEPVDAEEEALGL